MAADLIGAVLDGRYKVLDTVAEGAMGVVYRAERVKLGRIVAIKVLHDQLPNELASRKRFEIEAMAMAKLEHPHCAAVLDVGVHDEKPFVVMDFVSGQNLKELIAEGPVPIPRAVEIVRQTLSGLAHAHELAIIHRDIKPANIVLSQKAGLGDHVKILDFGLARVAKDSNLTTGIVVGTPSYMAPEQIRGTPIDKRADIYATGILMYELLTGKKPFFSQKDDPIEVCSLHLKQAPPRLDEGLPGTDFGVLEDVVKKALAKSPDDRYASAEEFAAALPSFGRKPSLLTPAGGVPIAEASAPSAPVERASSRSEPERAPSMLDAPPPAAPAPSQVKPAKPLPAKLIAAVGGGVLVVAVVVIVIATRGSKASSSDVSPKVDDPLITIDKADPASDVLSRANEYVANGRREAAIDLLVGARKTFPDDARLALLLGKQYFSKLWYTDGLKHLRDAVRLDPSLETDPELIKTVLKAFNTTPRYESQLATFLRETIGEPAKPYLEETARDHPSASIRARAASELRRY